MKSYYITTPIYYVNDVPHIGHAYTTIAADVAARFKRLAGYDVFFLTGTDEHGIKNLRTAEEHGVSPQEWVNRISAEFRGLWETLHISYDDFIRTTEPRHQAVAAQIFQRLYNQGDIYLGTYEGWYCTACETFYLESELAPDRTCLIHTGRPAEWTAEESYLFRLSKYQDWLLKEITRAGDPAASILGIPFFAQVAPESPRNEVIAFIRSGLRDIAVSRSTFSWGVPVPFDRRHVIYVWIDALTNYISALGYPDGQRFARYWPADIHLVGRDIVRFHAVIWPIILHAAGIDVPRLTFAHGFLTFAGQRFSKSLGIVIDPAGLSREIAAESGADLDVAVDALRYFLLREIPFGADGDFNKPALIHRFNADLANDYGNLLNRTLALVNRHFDAHVPVRGVEEGRDAQLRQTAGQVAGAVEGYIDQLDFRGALRQIWKILTFANKYLDEEAPWRALREGKSERAGTILYNTLEAVRVASILLSPWLVTAAARAWEQLGITAPLSDQRLSDAAKWGRLVSGAYVRPGNPIFPRIEKARPEIRRPGEEATVLQGTQGGEKTSGGNKAKSGPD